jgi:hypothetical protein
MHPLAKTVLVALFCGAAACTGTWIRRRQSSPHDRTTRPAGLTPAWAGATAILGALLGIAVLQGWSAFGVR